MRVCASSHHSRDACIIQYILSYQCIIQNSYQVFCTEIKNFSTIIIVGYPDKMDYKEVLVATLQLISLHTTAN